MVHRLQNRNISHTDHSVNTFTKNQATLEATEGATALAMNPIIEQNPNTEVASTVEKKEIKSEANDPLVENISMENATYLQNMEDSSNKEDLMDESNMPTFEVDSIELATPELFSEDREDSSFNQDQNTVDPTIFDNSKSIKSFPLVLFDANEIGRLIIINP